MEPRERGCVWRGLREAVSSPQPRRDHAGHYMTPPHSPLALRSLAAVLSSQPGLARS